MRKNDLIKLLSLMEGNPEIVLWNGFVEDVAPIKRVTKANVVSYKKKFVETHFPNSCRKKREWRLESGLDDSDVYDKRIVFVIEPKIVGKSTFDRNGIINY